MENLTSDQRDSLILTAVTAGGYVALWVALGWRVALAVFGAHCIVAGSNVLGWR